MNDFCDTHLHYDYFTTRRILLIPCPHPVKLQNGRSENIVTEEKIFDSRRKYSFYIRHSLPSLLLFFPPFLPLKIYRSTYSSVLTMTLSSVGTQLMKLTRRRCKSRKFTRIIITRGETHNTSNLVNQVPTSLSSHLLKQE